MSNNLAIAYFTHSVRSDWNNGNAHFVRGLLRAMVGLGHAVCIYEPEQAWSINNLQEEEAGAASLDQFDDTYPDLTVRTYNKESDLDYWHAALAGSDVVILHEWTTPELASTLLTLKHQLGFALLFHDTHHRSLSAPAQLESLGIRHFDGIIVFGSVLRGIYKDKFSMTRLWVLHEAADTTVFTPTPNAPKQNDVVWIGNWGDDERSAEIKEFLLTPVIAQPSLRVKVYGVRYPHGGIEALEQAGVSYGDYLPNLQAPQIYATSRITVHIPRRYYATTMLGIPTIRVFEALACGLPLISAPWQDSENLFRPGDLTFVETGTKMREAMEAFLRDPARGEAQAQRGLETIRSHHTCEHRAHELTAICREVLA